MGLYDVKDHLRCGVERGVRAVITFLERAMFLANELWGLVQNMPMNNEECPGSSQKWCLGTNEAIALQL